MSHLRALSLVSLAVALRVTADANRASVDVKPFSGECVLCLDSSATEAADNTLNVKVQHSDDNVTFVDSGVAFAQVTNAGASFQQIRMNVDKFKRYIRVVDDVAGTSPAVTRSVTMLAKRDRT
jgi:hypothetical protein